MKKLLALPIAFSLLCSACTASPASGGVTPETPQITSVVFQNQKTEAFVNLKQTQVTPPDAGEAVHALQSSENAIGSANNFFIISPPLLYFID